MDIDDNWFQEEKFVAFLSTENWSTWLSIISVTKKFQRNVSDKFGDKYMNFNSVRQNFLTLTNKWDNAQYIDR